MKPDKATFEKLLASGLEIRDAMVSSQSDRPERLDAGDLFLLKMPIPVPVTWCAVFSHSQDDDLWYCIPGDTFSEISNLDVAADDIEHMMPLNFRSQCGLWVHAEDIHFSNRMSQVSSDVVMALRAKVSALASDPIALLSDDESGSDPDYQNWIAELQVAVDSLRNSLHDEPTNSARLIGPDMAVDAYGEVLSLAADDSTQTAEQKVPILLETRQISDSGEGRLQVSLFEDGIIVEWKPKKEDTPTPTVLHDQTPLEWFPQQKDLHCTIVIPWNEKTVNLTLESEEISVLKPEAK